jgi:uncharacterized RDD family membrane protein YckC
MSTPNPFSAPNVPVRDVFNDTQTLASRGKRFGAAIIDFILQMAVGFPILLAFFGFSFTEYAAFAVQNQYLLALYGLIVGIVIYLVLHGYLLHTNGQTIGKKVLGIKVVRKDGSKADIVRLVGIRWLPFAVIAQIPFIGFLLVLVNYLMIFRESHLCFHDDLANTKVIDV